MVPNVMGKGGVDVFDIFCKIVHPIFLQNTQEFVLK